MLTKFGIVVRIDGRQIPNDGLDPNGYLIKVVQGDECKSKPFSK